MTPADKQPDTMPAERQAAFWRSQLLGELPVLRLPMDHPRPPVQHFVRGAVELPLPASLWADLSALAAAQETSLFVVLLTGLDVLLYRHTGDGDVIVGSLAVDLDSVPPGANGPLPNLLALRARLHGRLTVRGAVRTVAAVVSEAARNLAYPFASLVAELGATSCSAHAPIFQVALLPLGLPSELADEPLTPEHIEAVAADLIRCDLVVRVEMRGATPAAIFDYDARLFEAATAERLAQSFAAVLDGMIADPGSEVARLPSLSPAERQRLLVDWNATQRACPRTCCIHALFAEQVRQHPNAPAVEFGRTRWSYRELADRATRLADMLRRRGVGPEVPVAICMERSAEHVLAMLAVLQAGGAYVPLDPAYPTERLAFLLHDLGAPVVITQSQSAGQLPSATGRHVVLLDAGWEEASASEADREDAATCRELAPEVTPDHLAYIIYTSGSTGEPKGIAIRHRSVVRLVRDTNYIALEASDRVAQAATPVFDAATFEIWGAFLNGACLVGIERDVLLSPRDFATELRQRQVTALFLTTALFNQVARADAAAFGPLRHLLFGGERVDPQWVREVLQRGAPGRLLHVYGPTENTTFSTWHEVCALAADADTVPIGRALSNTQMYVLDEEYAPVPIGVAGELWLGGDGLARGYWRRPELTAEAFVPDPFGEEPGARLYRTGDRVRWSASGDLEFLGRVDHQVKIRGFRVELGEIEVALRAHPAVGEAVAVFHPTGAGDPQLVAYVVSRPRRSWDPAALVDFLQRNLPAYMVPRILVPLESMPLTTSGKADRRALPEPGPQHLTSHRERVPPRTALESVLVDIWTQVLGAPVGVQDDFFACGGHSLLAATVLSQLRALLQAELSLKQFFAAPTIAEQCALLLQDDSQRARLEATASMVVRLGRLSDDAIASELARLQLPSEEP